jgi:hypothetical protein
LGGTFAEASASAGDEDAAVEEKVGFEHGRIVEQRVRVRLQIAQVRLQTSDC